MIEYGTEVAEARKGNGKIEIFRADFERAKSLGFQDPPLGSDAGPDAEAFGPIKRGVLAAIHNAQTLRPDHSQSQMLEAAALGASLESLHLVDRDPGPRDPDLPRNARSWSRVESDQPTKKKIDAGLAEREAEWTPDETPGRWRELEGRLPGLRDAMTRGRRSLEEGQGVPLDQPPTEK